MSCLSLPALHLAPVVVAFVQCPQLFFFRLRSSASFRAWWSSCHLWQYNPYSDKATKRYISPTISNYLTQLTNKPVRLQNISQAPGSQKKMKQLLLHYCLTAFILMKETVLKLLTTF